MAVESGRTERVLRPGYHVSGKSDKEDSIEPLTLEEKLAFLERVKIYPEGVPAEAWGYGPIAEEIHEDVYRGSTEISPEEVQEYG